MPPRTGQTWIPLERLDLILQLEPALFIVLTALSAWFVYKLFLGGLTPERHRNLRRLFRNLLGHSLIATLLFVAYTVFQESTLPFPWILPYVGLLTIFWGCTVLVKAFRIYVFEYLFFMNMQTGVPLLLVNLLTLVFVILLGSWIATGVFQFRLAPVLATSAIFSVVLGLALQDTLGNLFSGVAIQLDKPFAIGDWVEIQSDGHKILGKVHEISWRATLLVSVTEELITIPNRMVAQSQISNYSHTLHPVLRSQVFRVPYGQDIEKVRALLLDTVEHIEKVRKHPEPVCFVTESTESWMTFKVIYSLKNFGDQYSVADKVVTSTIKAFNKAGIPFAAPRLSVEASVSKAA